MARLEYRPLYWCEVPIKGRKPIPVYLVSDEHDDSLTKSHPLNGDEIAAVCDREHWQIRIWAGEDRQFLHRHLAHELLHAVLSDDETIGNREEERVITALSDEGLEIALHGSGWKPPPLPDGWRGLAVHARAVRKGRAGEKRTRFRA